MISKIRDKLILENIIQKVGNFFQLLKIIFCFLLQLKWSIIAKCAFTWSITINNPNLRVMPLKISSYPEAKSFLNPQQHLNVEDYEK